MIPSLRMDYTITVSLFSRSEALSIRRYIWEDDASTVLLLCRYHFMSEHLPGEFQMKPSHGLVPPKDFNIITFRFEAGEPKLSVGHVVCTLNNSPAETMQVNLTASSHIPKV
jgi:hypothetical protein